MKIKILSIGIMSVIVSFSIHGKVYGFDNVKTHPSIVEQALVLDTYLDTYLVEQMGFTDGVDTLIDSLNEILLDGSDERVRSMAEWLQYGSYVEDKPVCRANRHFLDPLTPWPVAYATDLPAYLSDFVDNIQGCPNDDFSNVTWATDFIGPSPSGVTTGTWNEYDWMAARESFFLALTLNTDDERERYWFRTLRNLGQSIHLLQDMGVPAHTRNDLKAHVELIGGDGGFKWLYNRFEHYVEGKDSDIAQISTISPVDITDYNLTRFWDHNQYVGTDIMLSRNQGAGLAEYSNANFFSDNSIFTEATDPTDPYHYPNPNKSLTTAERVEVMAEDAHLDLVWYIRYSPEYWLENDNTFKLAAYSYVNEYDEDGNLNGGAGEYLLDDEVFQTYFDKLIPKTISYTAGITNYFFRGQMAVSSFPGGITITNNTGENMEGRFYICYDDITLPSERHYVWNIAQDRDYWALSLGTDQSNNSETITVYLPESMENTYTIVFKGRIGQEGDVAVDAPRYAVAGQTFTWEPPSQNLTYQEYDVGSTPKGVAVSPDGYYLYVADHGGDIVEVWDIVSNTKIKDITVGDGPNFLALTPNGNYLYVSNEWGRTVNAIDTATAIDPGTSTIVQTITGLSSMPQELEVNGDGTRLYETGWGYYPLAYVDLDQTTGAPLSLTATRLDNIGVNNPGQGLGLNPSEFESEFYATFNTFYYSYALAAVDIPTLNVTYVPGNPLSWGVAVPSSGNYIYYGTGSSRTGYSIRVLDAGTYNEVMTFPLPSAPYRLTADKENRIFYMSGSEGKVKVYDAVGNTEIKVIDVNEHNPGCSPLDGTVTNNVDYLFVTCPNINQVRRFPLDVLDYLEYQTAVETSTEFGSAIPLDSATLVLTGLPEDVRAYVDDLFPAEWDLDSDNGMLTLYGIASGSHLVRVMAPGYELYDLTVDLSAYETVEIPVAMVPAPY